MNQTNPMDTGTEKRSNRAAKICEKQPPEGEEAHGSRRVTRRETAPYQQENTGEYGSAFWKKKCKWKMPPQVPTKKNADEVGRKKSSHRKVFATER